MIQYAPFALSQRGCLPGNHRSLPGLMVPLAYCRKVLLVTNAKCGKYNDLSCLGRCQGRRNRCGTRAEFARKIVTTSMIGKCPYRIEQGVTSYISSAELLFTTFGGSIRTPNGKRMITTYPSEDMRDYLPSASRCRGKSPLKGTLPQAVLSGNQFSISSCDSDQDLMN
jgi:hypothetical protein